MDTVRILIVGDDHDIVQLIALHLREVGYQIDMVHDGETGLERAASRDYDLIVLDVVLPKLSGTELCLPDQPELNSVHERARLAVTTFSWLASGL